MSCPVCSEAAVAPFVRLVRSSSAKSRWLKSHAAHEKRLDRLMREYLREQRRDVQTRFWRLAQSGLAGVPADAIVAEIYDAVDWDERLIEHVEGTVEAMIVAGAEAELESLKRAKQFIEASDLSPTVQAALQAETDTILHQNFSPNINATTRQALAETMAEGVAAGESEYGLIVRIGDSPTVPGVTDGVLGSQSNTVRASLIARTETTGILSAGSWQQQEELMQQGLIRARRWSVTRDQYTRQSHLANDGVTAPGPESPDGLFQVGSQRVPYPGHHSLEPGERCNCRCSVIASF